METSLTNMVKPLSVLKIQKLARHSDRSLKSQVLGKLRQEKHLNPGGRGCREVRPPLHSSRGTRAKHLKKKKKSTGMFGTQG